MELHEDIVVMQNGRVVMVSHGDMTPLEEEIRLSNGTRVMPNGQIVMIDGTARMMAEGEAMNMNGKAADATNLPDQEFKEEMEDEELRDDIE